MTDFIERHGNFPVFIFFMALGVVFSWPLAEHVFDAIPYTYSPARGHQKEILFAGDHLQNFYHLGLLKLAAAGEIEWFSNPLEFATRFHASPGSSYFLPLSIVYLPFAFFSMTFAYNVFILLSFGFSGLAMYLWSKQMTGSIASGIVSGTVFNFAPIRLSELFGGHPAGQTIFLFPLALYFFDRAVSEKSPFFSIASSICVVSLAFDYPYFCYYLLMFLMVYIPWRVIWQMKKFSAGGLGTLSERKWFLAAGVTYAVGLAASVGAMTIFKQQIAETNVSSGVRTLGEVALYSPNVSEMWNPRPGYSVYLGVAVIAALFGLVYGLFAKAKNDPRKWDIIFFTSVFFIAYLLAFGVTPKEHIPLYELFYNYFPYFNFSRNPAKIMVITISMLSVLAGYMTAWALNMKTAKALWGGAVIIFFLGVIADYHPKQKIGLSVMNEDNGIYRRLAEEGYDGVVLNLPLWPGDSSWSSIYQYYALQSGVPMINGYHPVVSKTYMEKVFWPLFSLNTGDLAAAQAELLKSLNVGYIVFHEETYDIKVSAYPAKLALERLKNSAHLTFMEKKGRISLFAVNRGNTKAAPEKASSSPVGNMFQTEWLVRIKGKVVEDEDALNGYAMMGESGVKGILNAGPYRTFPAGKYKAVFRVRAEGAFGSEDAILKLDIAGDSGRKIIAERILTGDDFPQPGKYREFAIEYELETGPAWQIEFRSTSYGKSRVYIDSVYVLFKDRKDPQYVYRAEELFHTSGTVEDFEASGGVAVLATPGINPSDIMIFGPGRLFEKGDYIAGFRVKIGSSGVDKKVASLQVFSQNREKAIMEIGLYPEKQGIGSKYKIFSIGFELPERDFLEFRVIFENGAKLWVDTITVEPVA